MVVAEASNDLVVSLGSRQWIVSVPLSWGWVQIDDFVTRTYGSRATYVFLRG